VYQLTTKQLNDPDARDHILRLLHMKDAHLLWVYYVEQIRNHGIGFPNADLSGCDLKKIDLAQFDLQAANFEKCTLSNANLTKAKCSKANFKNANLEKAQCKEIDAAGADFTGANMRNCSAENANFKDANFDSADLNGAILKEACLEGADFSGTQIGSSMLNGATFNEKTKFAPGFQPAHYMVWTGAGADPRGAGADPRGSAATSSDSPAPTDFDNFVKELWGKFESERIQRALSMLQSEQFNLFADTHEGKIIGVARSQSTADRVYATQLSADGSYGCCTQNLRHCGALRGAACKHVFLMLLVLCKTDAIDPAKALQWLTASLEHKPSLDKDAMTKTFLRYKGVEDGTVDWRPIETIPEDYYAY